MTCLILIFTPSVVGKQKEPYQDFRRWEIRKRNLIVKKTSGSCYVAILIALEVVDNTNHVIRVIRVITIKENRSFLFERFPDLVPNSDDFDFFFIRHHDPRRRCA